MRWNISLWRSLPVSGKHPLQTAILQSPGPAGEELPRLALVTNNSLAGLDDNPANRAELGRPHPSPPAEQGKQPVITPGVFLAISISIAINYLHTSERFGIL